MAPVAVLSDLFTQFINVGMSVRFSLIYTPSDFTEETCSTGPLSIESSSVSHRVLKVAEHSFQEPMPNSPLLLSYLCFGARFLQKSRLTTERFILAFWLRCVLLPWQRGWLKNKA